MAYTFKLRGKTYAAESLADLSLQYGRVRDASGEGCSTFPTPAVRMGSAYLGALSYNGRIWNENGLMYDNRDAS